MKQIVLAVMVAVVMVVSGCQGNRAPVAERTGIVTAKGNPVTLLGEPAKAGDTARVFTAVANDMSTYTFSPGSGKVWIVSAVPSLDTPVCSAETKRFNDEAAKLGSDVAILTVSMDLPFAQKRWCGAEGVKNLTTVSDFRDRSFGQAYGVRIKENGLLARSIFVIDKTGRICYAQIVPELTHEPNYDQVLAAAKLAAQK